MFLMLLFISCFAGLLMLSHVSVWVFYFYLPLFKSLSWHHKCFHRSLVALVIRYTCMFCFPMLKVFYGRPTVSDGSLYFMRE